MDIKQVTVFGGSGFIGRAIVRALAQEGYLIRVACRRLELAERCKTAGDVGQVTLMRAKAERDGADEYHVTFVSPPEYEGMSWADTGDIWSARAVGIGRQADGESETYFVVLASAEIHAYRADLGLEPRDLHITLGFWPHDIYHLPKDVSTLIWTVDDGETALASA